MIWSWKKNLQVLSHKLLHIVINNVCSSMWTMTMNSVYSEQSYISIRTSNAAMTLIFTKIPLTCLFYLFVPPMLRARLCTNSTQIIYCQCCYLIQSIFHLYSSSTQIEKELMTRVYLIIYIPRFVGLVVSRSNHHQCL